jgi:hypothetical protein
MVKAAQEITRELSPESKSESILAGLDKLIKISFVGDLAREFLALDAEHEKLKEQAHWRRVEDELPEVDKNHDWRRLILIKVSPDWDYMELLFVQAREFANKNEDGSVFSEDDDSQVWFSKHSYVERKDITHWMEVDFLLPLPEPPEPTDD